MYSSLMDGEMCFGNEGGLARGTDLSLGVGGRS